MYKPIPAPSIASAIPPARDRIYFEQVAQYGFSPEAQDGSLSNAWWMAEASFAAYYNFRGNGPAIDLRPLTDAGYTISPIQAGDTQCIKIENGDVTIVAFRGTRIGEFKLPFSDIENYRPNWADVVTNAKFVPASVEAGIHDAFVHGGFLQAFRAIEEKLDALLAPAFAARRPVWFCGHSLGAAIATIAAYKYRDRAQGLYTFGSPRVGNGRFVNTILAELPNIYRFVHHRDIVTTVPPEGIPLATNLASFFKPEKLTEVSGYVHVGQLKYIAGGRDSWTIEADGAAANSLAALASDAFSHVKEVADIIKSGFSPFKPASWPIALDAVADHSPIYYTNKIYNALLDSSIFITQDTSTGRHS